MYTGKLHIQWIIDIGQPGNGLFIKLSNCYDLRYLGLFAFLQIVFVQNSGISTWTQHGLTMDNFLTQHILKLPLNEKTDAGFDQCL